jgi:hypothetical protein
VEEVLGWVLDGLSLSWKEYKSIVASERRITGNQPQSYKPMSRPVTRSDNEEEDDDRYSSTRPVPSYATPKYPQPAKRAKTKAHILGRINGEEE